MHNFYRLLRIATALKLHVELGDENKFEVKTKYGQKLKTIVIAGSLYDLALHSQSALYDLSTNLAHELGHYLIAPLGRRHRKDYGIPVLYYHTPRHIIHKWELDEYKATLVDNYLLAHCKLPHSKKPLKIATNKLLVDEATIWWENEGRLIIEKKLLDID